MRILVTGGAGFIGSHLVDRLLANGHEVAVVDDLSGSDMNWYDWEAQYYCLDCRNFTEVDRIFSLFNPEVVYHLAANAAENKAQFSPVDITSRNYSAFINVLTAFIRNKGKRFIFTSSIAVYGSLQTPFKESDKPEPEDLYGITKLAAEQTLHVMAKVHGFEYVILRPHNVYGERQNMKDPYRNVMTIWMNKILNSQPIEIYGDGEQRRCFTYISDVIDALYNSIKYPVSGMTFNIGSDVSYTLNELAVLLRAVTYTHLPDRPQEVKEAISDHTLSHKYLNLNPATPLEVGIKKTWEWVLAQGYQEPIFTQLEIESDKAPQNWKK